MLRAAFIVFWFLLYAAFLAWVLFALPPREHDHEREQHEDDREPGELPLAA
jgi:hypothetical protein